MELLSSVRRDKLSGDEFAYYALIYTQAQIKCGINVTSDSLIQFAYRYYKDTNKDLGIRAYFYNANVAHNRGDLQESMGDAIRAYEAAKEDNNFYWIAKSAELISDIFFESYNYSQAEIFTREAIDNYGLSDKMINQRYSLCDLAIIYLNENKNDKAIGILDSLEAVVKGDTLVDSNLLRYMEGPLVESILVTGGVQNLKERELSFLENGISKDGIIDNLILKSEIALGKGDLDNSYKILLDANLLVENDEQYARVLYARYQQAKDSCKYQKATILADTLLSIQSTVAENILRESVTGIQRDYYANRAREHEYKFKRITITLIIIILVVVTITILIVRIYYLKTNSKKIELESKITSLMYLKEQSDRINYQNKLLSDKLKEESSAVNELKKELDIKSNLQIKNAKIIGSLFREKWTTLNMLCNEYFEMGNSENTRIAILNNIEQELNKLRTKKSLKQIEEAVDTYLGGIMTCLRSECGFLKEEDFTFLSLVFAGFSVRAVCVFTDIKYKHYYLKKSRLAKRIEVSDALHKELFLNQLV